MLWWVVGILAGFYLFSSWAKRYANPYKLIYIFGLKGAGKSTYMVRLMLRDLKRGWKVYCNMSDVRIPGVRYFDSEWLKTHAPPPKSSVYIDEAGLIWDNRGFKTFDSGFTEFFKLQRKYKCKVVVNSQGFDVDKKIRDLVDRMYLMSNILNVIGVGRPIIRSIRLLEAIGPSEARIADNLRFDKIWHFQFFWMPKYFRYFKSFQAPERPEIPFTESVPPEEWREMKQSPQALLRRLRQSFDHPAPPADGQDKTPEDKDDE